MNRKQILILVVAGLLIGGAGLLVNRQQQSSWKSTVNAEGHKLLGDFPINDVSRILIKKGDTELNLVKQDIWKVKERFDYPANFGDISEAVRKMAELKELQTLKVGASQLDRLELSPGKGTNSATLVELKDKDGKTIRSLLLGKKHNKAGSEDSPMGGGWPDGRYLMVGTGANQPVYVVAEPFANLEPKPDQWLNKDFFKVDRLAMVSVTPTNASAAWKFERQAEGGELKLADKKDTEEVDASKVSALNNLLSYGNFVDVLPADTKPETVGLDKPITAEIKTYDHFTYGVKIGAETNGNYYLTVNVAADYPTERTPGKDEKPEDKTRLDKEFKDKTDKLKAKLDQEKSLEKWIYVVSKWSIESLLKDRTNWLAEKKTEPPTPPKPGEGISAPVSIPMEPADK